MTERQPDPPARQIDPSPPLPTDRAPAPVRRRIVHLRVTPRARRRLGLGLTAYGLTGLGLIVALLVVVAGPLGRTTGLDARTELVGAIDDGRESLRDATLAARDAETGLTAAAEAAGSTGTFMTNLGGTLRGLATALRVQIPIVGTAPFAGLARGFADLADRADGIAESLSTVDESVSTSAVDVGRLADDLDRLEAQLGRVSAAVDDATGGELDVARLVALALLGWLAVPAAISLWIGVGWLRGSERRGARTARPAR